MNASLNAAPKEQRGWDTTWMQVLDEGSRRFPELPTLVEGESKIVKPLGDGLTIVQLKPTLHSHSAGRTSVVEGTDKLRLESSNRCWQVLRNGGVPIAVLAVNENYYLSELVDAPPVEVVAKRAHIGTPKHAYIGMHEHRTRSGEYIRPDQKHEVYIRFDWRNPLPHRDEMLPPFLAKKFINTEVAEATALKAFRVLDDYFHDRKLDLLDICWFITADGHTVFGEVSPDCMRVKYTGRDLDKDLWRKGEDPSVILENWALFAELIRDPE